MGLVRKTKQQVRHLNCAIQILPKHQFSRSILQRALNPIWISFRIEVPPETHRLGYREELELTISPSTCATQHDPCS